MKSKENGWSSESTKVGQVLMLTAALLRRAWNWRFWYFCVDVFMNKYPQNSTASLQDLYY